MTPSHCASRSRSRPQRPDVHLETGHRRIGQERPLALLPSAPAGEDLDVVTHSRGTRVSHCRTPVVYVPEYPASRGYLHNLERPSPTTFKSTFMVVTLHTAELAPQPQSARGLRAWKQAPPSAAVAAACGLLSLSHGQVTQRGAAAATAAAPEDSAPRRFATGPRPHGPRPLRQFLPAIGTRERQLQFVPPIGWALLPVRRLPATASALLKTRPPIGGD